MTTMESRAAALSRRDGLRLGGWLLLALAGLGAPGQAQEIRSFALDIRDGHVAPDKRTVRVKEGDRVELLWTTDEAVELHLHGYEIRLDVTPGRPGTMSFEAHAAGRFPVGVHGSGGHGNIFYLEVHPR
jgi:FtsP/CotA-like multicopper oxidase with cupredoxin domain